MSVADAVEHPLVDFRGEGFVGSYCGAPIVNASEGRASLIADSARAGLRVVLVTSPASRLTFGMLQMLATAGGVWVVRRDDGALWDGLNGRVLESFADALTDAFDRGPGGGITDSAIDFLAPVPDAQPWLQLVVSVQHPPREQTVLGETLERLSRRFGDAAPVGWGVHEPAGLHWNRANVTRFARGGMPNHSKIYVTGRGERAVSATVRVSRSSRGVIEETRVMVALGTDASVSAELIRQVPGVLGEVATVHTVVLASAFLLRGRADLTIDPLLAVPSVPIAAVLGARLVQDLTLDLPDFESRFGAIRAGRPRLPSLVLPFTREGSGNWEQFLAVAGEFAEYDLTTALGTPASLRGARHAS